KASAAEIRDHRTYHHQLSRLCNVPVTTRIDQGADTYEVIRRVTADYDLLVLGASREQGLRTVFFGSHEHRVAENAQCS
ncbi:MAG: universal stress protein, partial [Myxococcota bacterium]|nr:universal stress protein [Myxococcota bacterium]